MLDKKYISIDPVCDCVRFFTSMNEAEDYCLDIVDEYANSIGFSDPIYYERNFVPCTFFGEIIKTVNLSVKELDDVVLPYKLDGKDKYFVSVDGEFVFFTNAMEAENYIHLQNDESSIMFGKIVGGIKLECNIYSVPEYINK